MSANPASDTGPARDGGSRVADTGGGPRVPPPPWQRLPDRPARRRRDPISRELIVDAAIKLLDREGLAALSMRRLAEELGTGAASLYWHVGSKDGLLDLVLDQIIGEGQIPDPDPARWREQLKEVAREQRRLSLRHPYLVRISIGRIPMGPNALRYSEGMLAILTAAGLPPRLAVQGYLLLISTVNGFTVDETGVEDAGPGGSGSSGSGSSGGDGDGASPRDPAGPQQAADMARDYIASLPAEIFPTMTGLADEFAFSDADERFELLIDIFVDGLARHAAANLPPPLRAGRARPDGSGALIRLGRLGLAEASGAADKGQAGRRMQAPHVSHATSFTAPTIVNRRAREITTSMLHRCCLQHGPGGAWGVSGADGVGGS